MSPRTTRLAALFAFGIVLLGGVGRPSADWYRWNDANGVLHFTDELENVPEPFRDRASPINIPPTPPRPAEPAELDTVSVPLESEGQVAVVLALLNGNTPASLIVDTGATYTVISHRMASELRIPLGEDTPVTRLQTANGVITAPVVELDSVEVGGMIQEHVQAAVHDFSGGAAVAGLLGLNFLRHFRVDIDTTARTLVLQRRTPGLQ